MQFLVDFHKAPTLGKAINSSFIALIPKVDSPMQFNDFRPMSLVGGPYKILSKVLAARLKSVMHLLVNEVQTGFIAGRQILDGILIASEMIHHIRRTKTPAILFKVDFEKAYDHLGWDYLHNILIIMGFGQIWCSWILTCLQAWLSVLINGSPTQDFSMQRGLRQGCSLSPLLFALAAEGLHQLMEHEKRDQLLEGIDCGSQAINISHLQFADDTLILIKADLPQIHNLKRTLKIFQMASGLQINFHKSNVVMLNITLFNSVDVTNILGCNETSLPLDYLGFKLGANPRAIKSWDHIVQKFKKKLALWQAKFLSLGGRITLIKSSLSSLPLYYMSLLKASRGVIRELEKWQRRFLWNGSVFRKVISKVHWNIVCQPKSKGGLGIRNLFVMNRALLAKWWWRFAVEKDSLWKRVLCARFGWDIKEWDLSNFLITNELCFLNYISSLLKDTLFCSTFGFVGVDWALVNGARISFWDDVWISDNPLKYSFQRLYHLSTQKRHRLIDFWINGDWILHFRRRLRGWELEDFHQLSTIIANTSLTGLGEDRPVIRALEKGFSVSSMFDHLQSSQNLTAPIWNISLWNASLPPKLSAFIWLLCHHAIPTKVFLESRGIRIPIADMFCPFCQTVFENQDHLLLICSFSRKVWTLVLNWWGLLGPLPGNVEALLLSWNSMISSGSRKQWTLISFITLWQLWLCRNGLIFQQVQVTEMLVLHRIQSFSFNLEFALFKKIKPFTFISWSLAPFTCKRKKRTARVLLSS